MKKGRGPRKTPQASESVTSVTSKMKQMSVDDVTVVTKPDFMNKDNKKGTCRKEDITCVVNYFNILSKPDFCTYQYHVSYEPEIESKSVRRALLFRNKDVIGDRHLFDGQILYLPIRLDQVRELTTQENNTGTRIKIRIVLTNEIPFDSPQFIQILNITFRRVLERLGLHEIGRNYFDTKNTIKIPAHKMEMMPGYTTSILNYDGGVKLCVDISNKVLRTDTVLDMMYCLFNDRQRDFHNAAMKKFIGQIVLTRHNNKTYRIDDINWSKRITDTFDRSSGPVKYKDYFKQQFNITIADEEQPMLMSLPKKIDIKRGHAHDIYLPPSLCVLTGLDEETRRNFQVMKDLHTHSRQAPEQKVQSYNSLIGQINKAPEVRQLLEDWSVQISSKLLEIPARVLPPEAVFMIDRGQKIKLSVDASKNEWGTIMNGKSVMTPVDLLNWMFVATNRDEPKVTNLITVMIDVAGKVGIRIHPPRRVLIRDDRAMTYVNAIRSDLTQDTQLVMCMFPNVRKDRYEAIKTLTSCEMPVPCQFVLGRTLERNTRSVVMKIVMQINCKLGGDLWHLDIPLKGLWVVGIDTYHKARENSVGAVVGSLNDTCTRFYSKASIVSEKSEIHHHLQMNISVCLKKYISVNGQAPKFIVIYRDGVGDGQLKIVLDQELPQIQRAFKDVAGELYNPNIYFVVVKKRINTRIMMKGNRGLQNPPPGTVVDSEITKPEWYDFFLVSANTRQGTVTPTHYNIKGDSKALKPDHMQRLAFKLCHLYYNWPGSIRVPAPCHYAHKLAYLVGGATHREPDPALCDKLFYL